jgi:hypothetical protein
MMPVGGNASAHEVTEGQMTATEHASAAMPPAEKQQLVAGVFASKAAYDTATAGVMKESTLYV